MNVYTYLYSWRRKHGCYRSITLLVIFISAIYGPLSIELYTCAKTHMAGKQQPTISFNVCNGFTNQRLSIVYGMLIARETNRLVVLPSLIKNGMQYSAHISDASTNTIPFGDVYDTRHFILEMKRMNVTVILARSDFQESTISLPGSDSEKLLLQPGAYAGHLHISLDCPLFHISSSIIGDNRDFMFGVLNALKLNTLLTIKVADASYLLGTFNFLHLRVESDWISHCASWEKNIQPFKARNCLANTFDLPMHLANKHLTTSTPLYVALDWPNVIKPIADFVMGSLRAGGYQLVVQKDIFPSIDLPREESAALEYYLAFRAQKFIGNSVSSFSALAILEREHRNLWASYYNMGDIPLAAFIPFYKMPWVFTYTGASPHYDYMAKVAVRSGISNGKLTPYCIYNGTTNDTMYQWFKAEGVILVLHTPSWLERIDKAFQYARKRKEWSPLYESIPSIVGTMLRIDIPMIRQLDQFNYVLYTDLDVLFMKQITIQNIERHKGLPKTIFMAHEIRNEFPCNAGVILMNLPGMRMTHSALVNMSFSTNDLFFSGYGPMDQGAINKFYRDDMNHSCELSELYNAKPYKNRRKEPYIVHFHGPKPNDYLKWLELQQCRESFHDLCLRGSLMMCRVAGEFARFSDNEFIIKNLVSACLLAEAK
jgi:hypothetical protein